MKKLLILLSIPLFFFSCKVDNGTNPGNPPPVPSNVVASKLEYSDKIKITWEYIEEADSYKVYRYTQKEPNPVFTTFNSPSNILEDSSVSENSPYLYRVASIRGGVESGQSANYVLGIRSNLDTYDAFEPNNDPILPKTISSGTHKASIFTFMNGEAQDIDCYSYAGTTITGNIVIPSEFKNGAVLRLRINGTNNRHSPLKKTTDCAQGRRDTDLT